MVKTKGDESSRRDSKRDVKSVLSLNQETTSFHTVSDYGEEEGYAMPVGIKLSRTSLFLQDYKQFKAARAIQKIVRGWIARKQYKRKRCAAIVIQRDWRRYFAKKYFYRLLEKRVQDEIEKHHRTAAVKLQAYWRGFLVREHIHDQYRMKRSQRMAVEDLMNCIAYKLHYLLRTHQIPGVYSLRNTHVLSKVEKLLISISFKQGNKRSLVTRLQRENDSKESRKIYTESRFGTKIPYAGPNFSSVCPEKCHALYKEPNIDARMHQILRKFEGEGMKQKVKCVSRRSAPTEIKYKKPKDPGNFCSDVVKSMRRWNILAPNHFTVRPDVFKNPENVAQFLTEIESMYEFMMDPCKCSILEKTSPLRGNGQQISKKY